MSLTTPNSERTGYCVRTDKGSEVGHLWQRRLLKQRDPDGMPGGDAGVIGMDSPLALGHIGSGERALRSID
jgi:hypothetical protein